MGNIVGILPPVLESSRPVDGLADDGRRLASPVTKPSRHDKAADRWEGKKCGYMASHPATLEPCVHMSAHVRALRLERHSSLNMSLRPENGCGMVIIVQVQVEHKRRR